MGYRYSVCYLPTGRKSHLLYSPAAGSSVCGIFSPGNWLGSGSRAERARAAALPPCRRCTNLIKSGYVS